MNVERLQTLADFLDTVPEDKFNIHTWGNPECGFAGCACGWACTIPAFKDLGLGIRQRVNASEFTLVYRDNNPANPVEQQDWEAAQAFFGLTFDEAYDLFHVDAYRTYNPSPADVAAQIRRFIGIPIVQA